MLFRLATSERLERAVKLVPAGEELAWRAASRYVAGRSREDGLATARRLLDQGHGVSVDLFGERVKDAIVADRVVADYLALAAALPPPPADAWLSVDLSHLALGAEPNGTVDRLTQIAAALPPARRVQVGAEEAATTDAALECVLAVAERGLADRLGATVQANLKRSPSDLDRLVDAGVHVRLVKGAYVEPITVAHPYGEATDVAYMRLAFRLAERGRPFSLATHDARLREAVLLAHGPTLIEQLLGVREHQLRALTERGIPTRVYIPYGADWFRYWLRRVAESRGA
ncbi:MAG: proline dehydrogenase family protein [Solirubrobacteraceae bacterium]